MGFRQHGHNQPDGFDEALAFLIIILISLFHSEPDLKHLREAFQSSLPRPDGLQHITSGDECSALFAASSLF